MWYYEGCSIISFTLDSIFFAHNHVVFFSQRKFHTRTTHQKWVLWKKRKKQKQKQYEKRRETKEIEHENERTTKKKQVKK